MHRYPLILLAAGQSSRMQTPKALLEFDGIHWITYQLKTFHDYGGYQAIVVLGYHAQAISQILSQLKLTNFSLSVIHNPHPEQGQFSSLCCGIKSALAAAAAWILPVDVPIARKSTFTAMAKLLTKSSLVVTPSYEGKKGHPVLIRREFLERLISLDSHSPDSRLDHQLALLHTASIINCPVTDARITYNLNTLADFESFVHSS